MATEARATLHQVSPQPSPALEFSTVQGNAVLSVSGNDGDHAALAEILDATCAMREASSLAAARRSLQTRPAAVVIWDVDSMGGEWRTLAAECASLPGSPHVIVASRSADASLWAEALNLGAWDVLAKPYDAQEVSRVLAAARARGPLRTRSAAAAQ